MERQLRDNISDRCKQLIQKSKELIERSNEILSRVELTNDRSALLGLASKEKSKTIRPVNATSLDLNLGNQDPAGPRSVPPAKRRPLFALKAFLVRFLSGIEPNK